MCAISLFTPVTSCRQSILTDKLDFNKGYWAGVSDEAKDFVKQLLQRDPEQRPTAKQALQHPWLKGGTVAERTKGKPLSLSVVQRIQVSFAVSVSIVCHSWKPAVTSPEVGPKGGNAAVGTLMFVHHSVRHELVITEEHCMAACGAALSAGCLSEPCQIISLLAPW